MVRLPLLVNLLLLLFLGACASLKGDKLKAYREAYSQNDFSKAKKLLKETGLKKDEKSKLLWELEQGSVASALKNHSVAIKHFQTAIDLIDALYTKKLSAKAASFLVNDASDVFYGANYERSYAYYYLAKSYYARYLDKGDSKDLQGARAAILAWDTYFTELQRNASYKTLYHTDLMLKVFGGEVHEVSEIANDKQIALQLYKDALKILDIEGGFFSLFNKTTKEYIQLYEENLKDGKGPPSKHFEKTAAYFDLRNFLIEKVLVLTKDVRGFDFDAQVKSLKAPPEIVKKVKGATKNNVVLILEEGLIPEKVAKPFNIGIKGAIENSDSSSTKKMIATVGVEFITAFAMNQLGLLPKNEAGAGSFIFAHTATKLAVTEASVEFQLPMIDEVPLVKRLELFVLNEKGEVVQTAPMPVISENGDIARVVLEEDASARYFKTGMRVASKHLVAIIAALGVYQSMNGIGGSAKKRGGKNSGGGNFLATAAALGTYVAGTKGIAALEKADTRYWSTLPQALRMVELNLAVGKYQIALAESIEGQKTDFKKAKTIGNIEVKKSDKSLYTLTFQKL